MAAVAIPVAAAAFAVAVVRRDGLTLDRLAYAAIAQRLRPRRLVPGSVPALPRFVPRALAAAARPLPAPLALPVTGIGDDGVAHLAGDGHAVIIACSTVSFALATAAEQEAMVTAFARVLNSLTHPVQIVASAQRVDLAPH